MKKFIERRRYPRIEKKLPIKLLTDEYEVSTETKNLSCIGAYCTVDRDIPVLTKLSIMLILPKNSKDKYTKVHCRGVVVRKEVINPTKFNIAIFFNDITPKEKNKILKYINKHVLKI
jgi:c-di-GMP-binding flagellar brake protein YcgR